MHRSVGAHRGTRLLWAFVAALGVLYPLFLVAHAHGVNGRHGFPLDNSWIDLTYARNLRELGRLAYTPGADVSAGSTSPLHTLILTAGFVFTSNEKILGYAVSALGQVACLIFFFAWARARLQTLTWAFAAGLLLALDARLGLLAASGMDTTLFCAFVAFAFWARATGRWGLLGLALGLSIWARPEGLLLAVVLLVDASIDRTLAKKWGTTRPPKDPREQRAFSLGFVEDPEREPAGEHAGTRNRHDASNEDPTVLGSAAGSRAPDTYVPVAPRSGLALVVGITTVFAVLFAIYNLSLGGGPLPNTFAARTAHFAQQSRLWFLLRDVPAAFSANGWLVLFPLALLQGAWELRGMLLRRPGFLRAEHTWAALLCLAYLFALPNSGAFSRYLIPALPAVCLLGLGALRRLTHSAQKRSVWRWSSPAGSIAGVILVVSLTLQVRGAVLSAEEFQQRCHYHYIREERTADWIVENTVPSSVIATHSIGAIGFYCQRDIFDLTGVTNPRLLPHLGKSTYIDVLEEAFFNEGVTHLAVVRSWLEIDNVSPVFVADPVEEVLEVYAWIPSRTHLVAPEVTLRNARSFEYLETGELERAIATLEESVRIDSESSRAWFLLGLANEMGRRLDEAQTAYQEATVRFPHFGDAWFRLTQIYARQAKWEEAYASVKQLLVFSPNYPGAEEVKIRIEHELVSKEIEREAFR